ncbi:MAG: hypothetical protein K9N34_02510 [Candidatus Marinimicrobia bacterium]|nr:hypothetical protein [Candidatus Neomarinimicrobiota bacterium]MCF7839640.1 hypothetical protein [Candidatus Neomarinimicrobiota bacterium]MCF7902536.1 hypothetical protein [Candidatus Neomarinimicrobiota bacterium]
MGSNLVKRFILGFLLVASGLFAQTNDGNSGNRESWYTLWSLGSADITYPSDFNTMMNYLEDQEGVTRTKIAMDFLGFYKHLTPQTIGGFVINAAADRMEDSDSWMQFNHYIYGLSMITYPGDRFGSGLFLRADAGLAKMVLQDSDGDSESSENGYGLLGGAGYSFDLGGTRLLINVNYALRRIEDEDTTVMGISLSGLF